MQRALVIAAVALLAACAAKSSTAPPNFNVTGSWSGSISDALVGTGALSMSLAQTGDSVTGSWSTTYADTMYNLTGRAAGHVIGSTFTVLLRPFSPPTCQYGPFQFTATQAGGASISGTYTTVQCTVADSGTISVAIQ